MSFVTSASGVPQITKDPDAVLDYSVDWTDWLAGDTISTATFTVPAGLTKLSSALDGTSSVATAWLSGGTSGTTYSIMCRIVTIGGRTEDRTFQVKCKDR